MQAMNTRAARRLHNLFVVGIVAALAAGGYVGCRDSKPENIETGSARALGAVNPPGLSRVVTSGGILAGSGTTSNPLTATITTSGLTGTGSAGSPLTGVAASRSIATTAPLSGGGDLSADRTLTVSTFTSVASGVVGASGGGTSNFLRADGSWSIPPGTGAVAGRNIFTTSPLAGGGDLTADRTFSITANGIDNTLLRQGGATSVIGRSANSTGNVADVAASSDGQALMRMSGALTWQDLPSYVPTIVPYLGIFGDGSDGALTFDGSSTVLGFVPSANRYLVTRDINATNVTINSGVVVVFGAVDNEGTNNNTGGGKRLFATGTATINGKITQSGSAGASGATGHSGGAPGFFQTGPNSNQSGGGQSGAGSSVTGPTNHFWATASATAGGTAGNAGSNATGNYLGGGGGGGSTGAGGTGGSTTVVGVANNNVRDQHALTTSLSLGAGANAIALYMGGSSGGGGGGDGSHFGGAGGGGGGIACVIVYSITGSGSIEAKGGDGGPGSVGGNTGGGGGGGGGTVVIEYATGTPPTTVVTGGNGGVGVGSGKNGGNGSAGKTFLLH